MKRDTITLVLVSDTREPLTIEFSLKELLLIIVLLLSLIGAAVFSFVNFKSLQQERNRLVTSIRSLEEELALRESRIRELRKAIDQKKGVVLIVDEKRDTSKAMPGRYSDDISIEELDIGRVQGDLRFSFNLVNNTEGEELYSGYLMVLAEHESMNTSLYATFPEFQLADSGDPVNYRQGDPFSIRRFKVVDGVIDLQDRAENYSALKMLVFDKNGRMLLYETHPLEY